MARGFGSTFGTGSTDSVKTSYTTSIGTGKRSYSIWIFYNGVGGGSAARIFDKNTVTAGTTGGELCNINGGNTSQLQFNRAWSGSAGTLAGWTFTRPSGNQWHHILITYDSGSTSNNPTIYVDGSSVSISVSSAPSGSVVNNTDAFSIGNRVVDNSRNWDGKLAEFAIWNGVLLTASEAAALGKGVPALFVRPASLSVYAPLLGVASGEPDWGPAHGALTVTGAKKVNHAPVSFWTQPATIAPTSRFAGSLALAQGAAATSLNLREKFAGSLALTAPADQAALFATQQLSAHPGRVAVADAATGGLLGLNDRPAGGLNLADTGLYRVNISESV